MRLHGVRVLRGADGGMPVRLRVLLVHWEPWWDRDGVLPTGAGFFTQVLREAAVDRDEQPVGPLGAEISLRQALDTEWIGANAHRFVTQVEQVAAVRNHPVDEGLAAFYRDSYDVLDTHDLDESIEEGLVQAEYDVWVSDPRWVETLRAGQCWRTDAWESPASAGAASARLGFLLAAEDHDGAVAAYRRAIELGDPDTRVLARLELDELLAGRDLDGIDFGRRARRALELCVRLHQRGDEDAARSAYFQMINMSGDHAAAIGEVRRRTGMAGPAEQGYRLARAGEPARAAALLRVAYDEGSSQVASFAHAVYQRDFARAEQVFDSFGGDLVMRWGAEVAMELSFVYLRGGDKAASHFLLERVMATGYGTAPLVDALVSGSAQPADVALRIGTHLVRQLVGPASDEDLRALVEAARQRLPELATRACRMQAECLAKLGDHRAARRWLGNCQMTRCIGQ